MATLYVENIPKDRYEALRRSAKERRRSIAAEILFLLEANYPTERELKKRRKFHEFVTRLHARKRPRGSFPTAEQMIREDRER